MFYSRRQLVLLLLPALYAFVHPYYLASNSEIDDKESVPKDFKIFARYYPGYSNAKAWKTTITSGGEVSQDVLGKVEWESQKLPSLTRGDLKDLLAKLKEADFFSLKERYTHHGKDMPTLVLKITLNKKTYEVDVDDDAVGDAPEEEGVKRFRKVWNEVLKKTRSPNPDQKPK